MEHKVGFISLGCAKNLVDSEQLMGMLDASNVTLVTNPHDADTIIINTCGFIDSSKAESIDTILEMAAYHKKLVVVGCLAERYLDDLKRTLPEVDLFVPIRDYDKLPLLLNELWNEKVIDHEFSYRHRLLSTLPFTAYLRISEGCNNCCTYCAIPIIRGPFRSRNLDEILKEAQILKDKGIKEVVVISQDTTRYGSDFSTPTTITHLLKELLKIKEFEYIRLLYLYPDEIDDELLYLIRDEPRLTPYFDLPIQHASDHMLSRMRRRGNQHFLRDLIQNRIRKIVPNAIIRTTIIVGFPGETDKDFQELLSFVKEMQFDHLGAFTYSREEGTASYNYSHQVSEKKKNERYNELMKIQKVISYHKNKALIGSEMRGIVIGYDQKHHRYLLRSGWNAPDDIDGKIYFTSLKEHQIGDITTVKITNCFGYDLEGEEIIIS